VSGWKTLLFNALCSVATLLDLLSASPLQGFIPPDYQLEWALFVIGGNVVLRWFTTGPIAGWRPKEEPDA
jgi:hypothetical protein